MARVTYGLDALETMQALADAEPELRLCRSDSGRPAGVLVHPSGSVPEVLGAPLDPDEEGAPLQQLLWVPFVVNFHAGIRYGFSRQLPEVASFVIAELCGLGYGTRAAGQPVLYGREPLWVQGRHDIFRGHMEVDVEFEDEVESDTRDSLRSATWRKMARC